MNVGGLLKPKKICVVGASEKEGFGGDTCRNIIANMEPGRYFFVNNRKNEVFGHAAYPSIAEVPENFDLAVVCTPHSTVENILAEASKRGALGAVVYASGYKEAGPAGASRQESLKRLCESLGIGLVGPNCAGFVNFTDGVYPFAFISENRDRAGAIGFVSQSGQLCLSMMDSKVPKFSYVISAGNCAVTIMEDYIDFLIDDDATKVVAIYMEGIQNPEKFTDSLKKAANARKPVVALKTGKSAKGSRTAASHTGSLAGEDAAYEALFRKFGVARVDDLEELIHTSQMFTTLKSLPKNSSFASISLSGGETGICADAAFINGIEFPDFSEETSKSLAGMLPSYARPVNPLDATATLSYDADAFAGCLRVLMKDENCSAVLIGYTLLGVIVDPAIHYIAQAIKIVSAEPGAKPVIMIPFIGGDRNAEYIGILERCGVPVLPPAAAAFKILRYLSDFVKYDPADHDLRVAIPSPAGGKRVSLGEYEAGREMSRHGIPFPRGGVSHTLDEAMKIAGAIGFPVAVKVNSPDIAHKSDVGCVRVGVANPAELTRAYEEVLSNARANCPGAAVSGVGVYEMASQGMEMIIGVKTDPQFGPLIMAGMGGTFAEALNDTSIALAPLSRNEAANLVFSLKGSKLLSGWRGAGPRDVSSVIDAVMAASGMAVGMKDVMPEADLNPIMVYEAGAGVIAVDALLIIDSGGVI
jgi:acetyltransferase